MRRFRLTLAQMAPVVGNLGANMAAALRAQAEAGAQGADMVVLPEMFRVRFTCMPITSRDLWLWQLMKQIDVELNKSPTT